MWIECQGSGQDVGRPGAGRRGLSVRSRDAAQAAGEDPSAAARRGSPGEGACPSLSLGTPTSERPRARRACEARPDPPRWLALRLATCSRAQAGAMRTFAFWRRETERLFPSFLVLESRLSSGSSRTPDPGKSGSTPRRSLLPAAVTPDPEVKRSQSLPVRAWSAVPKFPTCRLALEGGVGDGDGWWLWPLGAADADASPLHFVYFPDLL